MKIQMKFYRLPTNEPYCIIEDPNKKKQLGWANTTMFVFSSLRWLRKYGYG
jgi:hypothetical protein